MTRVLAIVGGFGVALATVALGALFVGGAGLSPSAVVGAVLGRSAAGSVETTVVLDLRVPRIAAAALAGGALAVAGVGFQGLTRNPLADPAILGVSSGAAFGVVAVQLSGLALGPGTGIRLAAAAFLGALVAGGLVHAIAWAGGQLLVQTLLLAGVIVGIFFSASIAVLTSLVDANRLAGVIHWLLGNVAPVPPASLAIFAALTALGVWIVAREARELNLLALGEEPALQLGVDARRLKRRIFLGAALLTATVVAFSGPIGFVGLVVPHMLRLLLGPDHRVLVPAALVGGAIFLLVADTLARSIVAPGELSVGVITSFCGAPFFVYLLRTRPGGLA